MMSFQFLASVALICQFFSVGRIVSAAPISGGQSYYTLVVTFQNTLSSNDKNTILKTMSLLASNPIQAGDRTIKLKPPTFPTPTTGETQIVIVGKTLSPDDKAWIQNFASSLINSYVIVDGNSVANVVVNDVNQPSSVLHDDSQTPVDTNIDPDYILSS